MLSDSTWIPENPASRVSCRPKTMAQASISVGFEITLMNLITDITTSPSEFLRTIARPPSLFFKVFYLYKPTGGGAHGGEDSTYQAEIVVKPAADSYSSSRLKALLMICFLSRMIPSKIVLFLVFHKDCFLFSVKTKSTEWLFPKFLHLIS